MRAGQLRHHVSIEEPTAGSADGYGATADTWATRCQVWASVEMLTGDEAVRAAQVRPEAGVQVRIRYRTDIEEAMRIRHGSRYLHIVAVIPDPREAEFLTLLCREER